MNSIADRNHQLIGRVALTIAVAWGASSTILRVSGALTAIEQIDRLDNTRAELSRYIANGHASIREGVMTRGPSDAALARFDTGVAHRMKRLSDLNALLAQQTSAYVWTQRLREDGDVHPAEEERRAYLAAARTAATAPVGDLAMSLRLLDLRAQKLIQTVEAARDSGDAARAQALAAVDGLIALALSMAGLLIAYLIWHPVFGDGRQPAEATLIRQPTGPSPAALPLGQTTVWLPGGTAVPRLATEASYFSASLEKPEQHAIRPAFRA